MTKHYRIQTEIGRKCLKIRLQTQKATYFLLLLDCKIQKNLCSHFVFPLDADALSELRAPDLESLLGTIMGRLLGLENEIIPD